MLTGLELGGAIAEAIRLKGVSKAAVARHFNIKGPSIYDWIKYGRVDKKHLTGLFDYFADVVGPEHWGVEGSGFMPQEAATVTSPPVSTSETPSAYVHVEQLDAEAGMGGEVFNDDYPEVIRAMDFTPSYIRQIIGFLPPPGRLVLLTGRGDSMQPVIQPGDVVVVDTGVNSFDGDGLYLINMGGGHQIKRLLDRGQVHVSSDNPSYGGPFPIPEGTLIGGKVYLRNRIERIN